MCDNFTKVWKTTNLWLELKYVEQLGKTKSQTVCFPNNAIDLIKSHTMR